MRFLKNLYHKVSKMSCEELEGWLALGLMVLMLLGAAYLVLRVLISDWLARNTIVAHTPEGALREYQALMGREWWRWENLIPFCEENGIYGKIPHPYDVRSYLRRDRMDLSDPPFYYRRAWQNPSQWSDTDNGLASIFNLQPFTVYGWECRPSLGVVLYLHVDERGEGYDPREVLSRVEIIQWGFTPLWRAKPRWGGSPPYRWTVSEIPLRMIGVQPRGH